MLSGNYSGTADSMAEAMRATDIPSKSATARQQLLKAFDLSREQYEKACHGLAQATAVKEAAYKELSVVTENLAKMLETALYGPTFPQAAPSGANPINPNADFRYR